MNRLHSCSCFVYAFVKSGCNGISICKYIRVTDLYKVSLSHKLLVISKCAFSFFILYRQSKHIAVSFGIFQNSRLMFFFFTNIFIPLSLPTHCISYKPHKLSQFDCHRSVSFFFHFNDTLNMILSLKTNNQIWELYQKM